jgi:XTP/dITP diphosphohydrolase
VHALGGEPGVFSARYAGPNATDADRMALLLKKLEGVPFHARLARFVMHRNSTGNRS